jgi:hypothetical protein
MSGEGLGSTLAVLLAAAAACGCTSERGASSPDGGGVVGPRDDAGGGAAGSAQDGQGSPEVASGPDATAAEAGPADGPGEPVGDAGSLGPPFVAVGYSSLRAYSADGKSWTQAPAPAVLPPGWTGPPMYGDNQWLFRGACAGPGKFLAVGGTGGDLGLMLSSADGQAWTLVGGAQSNNDCAYGNGLWVTQIRWSQDGASFTKLASGVSARRIVYGDGIFVAAGDNAVSYTRDGQHWTSLAITYTAAAPARKGYDHAAFGNHHFLAVNTLTADAPIFEWDGASDSSFSETPHPPELAGVSLYDLAYGRHAFYLASFNALYRRPDGSTTWEKMPGTGAAELYNLVVTDDLFVDDRWWSTDGAQWNKATNAPANVTRIVATPH